MDHYRVIEVSYSAEENVACEIYHDQLPTGTKMNAIECAVPYRNIALLSWVKNQETIENI
jgi:hypothetical protein